MIRKVEKWGRELVLASSIATSPSLGYIPWHSIAFQGPHPTLQVLVISSGRESGGVTRQMNLRKNSALGLISVYLYARHIVYLSLSFLIKSINITSSSSHTVKWWKIHHFSRSQASWPRHMPSIPSPLWHHLQPHGSLRCFFFFLITLAISCLGHAVVIPSFWKLLSPDSHRTNTLNSFRYLRLLCEANSDNSIEYCYLSSQKS